MSTRVDLLGTFQLIVGVSQLDIPYQQVRIPLSLNYTCSHEVPLDYATLEAHWRGSQQKCRDTFLSSEVSACKMTPLKIGLAIFSSWSPLRSIAPNEGMHPDNQANKINDMSSISLSSPPTPFFFC